MSTLKQQLYQEVANKSLVKLQAEFRTKYTAKKKGRFSKKGITYEMGTPRAMEDGIYFEISSKIPFEQLPPRASKERFFRLITGAMEKEKKNPYQQKWRILSPALT